MEIILIIKLVKVMEHLQKEKCFLLGIVTNSHNKYSCWIVQIKEKSISGNFHWTSPTSLFYFHSTF